MGRTALFLALLGFLSSGSVLGDCILEKMEATLKALKVELSTLQRAVGPKVAFSASLTNGAAGFKGPGGSTTLIYRHVFTNTGNAYNRNTGKFTAPVRGVYYFNINTFSYNRYDTGVILVKNGHLQVSTWEYKGKDRTHSLSNSVVLTLNPRDTVHVIHWQGTQVYDSQNKHTTFSGFLLFPQ